MTGKPTQNGAPPRRPRLARLVLAPAVLLALGIATATAMAVHGTDWWRPDGLYLALRAFAALLAVVLLVWLQVRRHVERPLARVEAAVEACAVNARAARVPDAAPAELAVLRATVNRLLDRVVRIETTAKAVLGAAGDAIVTINHRGIVQSFNPAAEAIFGYPAAAIIGSNIARLMPKAHAQRHDQYIQRYLETGVAKVLGFAREEVAQRADGTNFPISICITRMDLGEGPPMFCGILRDISEQKRAEREIMLHTMQLEDANQRLAEAKMAAEQARAQADAANQSKSDFLANMSHEIRTPITAILGFAENLMDEKLPDRHRHDAVETILRNGEHLMALINDILDLSKIEAGKLAVETLEFSAIQLLADVASLMRVRAQAKKLRLEVHYDCPLPATVRSDPTRLRQVLINLCGNAIKFTERGEVHLGLALQRGDGGRLLLRFSVTDSGIGMTRDQIGILFRPFQQADTSTTRRFGGTGLGLSISRRLVERLGGSIGVDSEPGRGSTFHFTIDPGPLAGVPMLTDATEALAGRKVGGPSRRRATTRQLSGHILLAEDGPDNQRLLVFLLEKAGAQVTVVGDGLAAVESALAAESTGTPFDLVLMDMQMPRMDGYEATRTLRDCGFGKPIVALTANAMTGDRERCLQAGCTDFAPKPVDRRALLDTLGQLLEQSRGAAARPGP